MARQFTICDELLHQVILRVQEVRPDLTGVEVRAALLDYWEEGEEHQRWLDSAQPAEMASWVLALHS